MNESLTLGRVLVTGGAGFIGSHLVARLLGLGYEVRVLDDFSSGHLENLGNFGTLRNFTLLKGSVADGASLSKSMAGINTVFHLAAIASVSNASSDSTATERINVGGTLAVLEEARRKGVGKFIFASSAAVYGNASRLPLKENHPFSPVSVYGVTKTAGELFCNMYFKSYGIKTTILRYFNVYGAALDCQPRDSVTTRFADDIKRGDKLIVHGDGRQTRDFVHVIDAVDCTILAAGARNAPGEAFNVGTGTATSISGLAKMLLSNPQVLRKDIVYTKGREEDVRYSLASIEKASSLLGYVPRINLRQGLADFLEWYLDR